MTPEAVAAVYRAQRAGLVRLARGWVRDQPSAEDVVQEVFLALLTGPEPRALHSYLSVSVINRSRTVLRHRGVVERHPPAPPGVEPSAERLALDRVDFASTVRQLQQLPPMQRRVMALRIDGVPVDQVAALLGVAPGTVKSHASRARRHFRECA